MGFTEFYAIARPIKSLSILGIGFHHPNSEGITSNSQVPSLIKLISQSSVTLVFKACVNNLSSLFAKI